MCCVVVQTDTDADMDGWMDGCMYVLHTDQTAMAWSLELGDGPVLPLMQVALAIGRQAGSCRV